MELIKCPKCKSVFISITVDTTAELYYIQDLNGLHPNGGEQTGYKNNRAYCHCEDCEHDFRISRKRVDEMPLNEDFYEAW